jgi:hypothetical protein
MISRIHRKLGTAGFIISIVALVVALGGGAYAASGGLTGKQKKEVEKIAKKYAGKQGATGATGATGPAGATGPTGSAGPKGDTGAKGDPGEKGQKGEKGDAGKTGFTETLPSGETETGLWSVGGTGAANAEGGFQVPISFNIPVAGTYAAHVLLEGEGETVECPGTAEEPEAAAGNLCVYVLFESEVNNVNLVPFGPFPFGAYLNPSLKAGGKVLGSFAVTAP